MSTQIKLLVAAISCKHCAMTIRRELEGVEGVRALEVDVPNKLVTLEYSDESALKQAEALLAEIGYPAQRTK